MRTPQQTSKRLAVRIALMVSIVALAASREAQAQRLLDWPVRTSVVPDALVTGAAAAFWNPAALGTGGYRGEIVVVNLRTPEAMGLAGFAGAAAAQLEETTFAIAYEHVGIDEITLTDERPDESSNLSLGEDHFTLAARRALGSLGIGAVARYARDNVNGTDPVVGLGVGAHLATDGRFALQIGGFAISEQDVVAWGAGVQAPLPILKNTPYQISLAYGASGRSDTFITHRATATAEWERRATVSGGVAREGDGDAAEWTPVMAASLRFSRYALGVVRESLANGFGAAYSFRLQIGIGN